MCRLAAYTGPPLPLKRLLLDPEHSLMQQSWASREMGGTTLNADGFGFGWHTRDGHPAVYSSIFPIWNDRNLEGLGRALNAGQWLANVRSPRGRHAPGQADAQPFASGRMLFQHNGYIAAFKTKVRFRFDEYLREDIRTGMQGSSDSEYLFALFRQCVADANGDFWQGLIQNIRVLPALLESNEAVCNIVAGDGDCIVACRHAFNGGNCPSLYYTEDHQRFPGGVVVASERLDDSPSWRAVEAHSALIAGNGRGLRIAPLT